MTRRSSLDRSDVIHSASRLDDSATNRREAADFEVPSPAMTGRSPSGSRTARLSLRVDTLISIRFMAQRPSQSSACAAVQVGSTIHTEYVVEFAIGEQPSIGGHYGTAKVEH